MWSILELVRCNHPRNSGNTMRFISESKYEIRDKSLENMVLDVDGLPNELRDFTLLRESFLDNKTMATHGFPGNTEEGYTNLGRITGYLREFASPTAIPQHNDASDIVAATIVHLFRDEASAKNWMTNMFVNQFEENLGKEIGDGQKLVTVEKLEIDDFYEHSVGIRAVQDGAEGILSTTVIDFQMGQLLGVSFVVTVGDHGRTELTTMLGLELERSIVRELLSTN